MTEDRATFVEQDQDGCPIDPVLRLLALKWLVHIVWFIGRRQALRFSELQQALPGQVSAKVLSARLKELERLAIIDREDKGTVPPHVIYRLTPSGQVLDKFLVELELRARQLSLPDISSLSVDLQAD